MKSGINHKRIELLQTGAGGFARRGSTFHLHITKWRDDSDIPKTVNPTV